VEHIKTILPRARMIPVNTSVENMESLLNTDCSLCNGAGFVHPIVDGKSDYANVVPCECTRDLWETKRKAFILAKCNFPPFAEDMSFDNFDIYPEVKTAYADARKMADNPGHLSWLAFMGVNGNGKTHLAVAICKAWLNADIPAKYKLVSLLLEELREGINHNGEESYERKFEYYCNVPLLLLDDYGIESSTKWVQEKLDTLIDYRLMNNLSLIITSNLTLDEMPPRIRSRIMRHPNGKIVAIMADDYAMRRKV